MFTTPLFSRTQPPSTPATVILETNKIAVYARLRPFHSSSYLHSTNDSKSLIFYDNNNTKKKFSFTKIFDEKVNQEKIYNETVMPMVGKFVNGMDCLLFHYGYTGSGKTYTCVGVKNNPGIIPRVFNDVFNNDCRIKISYSEVYKDNVYDLLVSPECYYIGANKFQKPREKLEIFENESENIHIEGLTKYFVNSPQDCLKLLIKGNKYRQTCATRLNEHSSRSHSIFTFYLVNKVSMKEMSKFSIVDLAGSEGARKTQNTPDRQREANSINSTLLYLSNCINALRSNQRRINMGNNKQLVRVPYRNCKLTRFLGNYFNSVNCVISIIVNLFPTEKFRRETLQVLKFGSIISKVIPITTKKSKKIKRTQGNNDFSTNQQLIHNIKCNEVQKSMIIQKNYSDFYQYLLKKQKLFFLEQANKTDQINADYQNSIQTFYEEELNSKDDEIRHYEDEVRRINQERDKMKNDYEERINFKRTINYEDFDESPEIDLVDSMDSMYHQPIFTKKKEICHFKTPKKRHKTPLKNITNTIVVNLEKSTRKNLKRKREESMENDHLYSYPETPSSKKVYNFRKRRKLTKIP